MSGKVEAVIGGPSVGQVSGGDVEPVEEGAHSEYYNNHEYAVIFGRNGPWVLCLSCEWSADLPEEVVA